MTAYVVAGVVAVALFVVAAFGLGLCAAAGRSRPAAPHTTPAVDAWTTDQVDAELDRIRAARGGVT